MMKYRKPATHAARLALLKNVLYRKHCMMVEIDRGAGPVEWAGGGTGAPHRGPGGQQQYPEAPLPVHAGRLSLMSLGGFTSTRIT